jgi:hypothetical protein
MAEDSTQTAVVEEIANLLDQCSPEELTNILEAIEGGDGLPTDLASEPAAFETKKENGAVNDLPLVDIDIVDKAVEQQEASQAPVPPTSPPPSSGNGRRPVPPGYKRTSSGEVAPDEAAVSVGEMKKMLEEHSAGVLNEVRKLLPFPALADSGLPIDSSNLQAEYQSGSLNLETLTAILAQRDHEVKGLEARLAELQDQLSVKDRRVMDLNGELDCAIREVRHRQLDLEFQQLKLEERVRSNNDLEQAHRSLTARVEEANRDTRHAALDVDLARSLPRSARVQGSLPWMLRKNRPWGTDTWGTP